MQVRDHHHGTLSRAHHHGIPVMAGRMGCHHGWEEQEREEFVHSVVVEELEWKTQRVTAAGLGSDSSNCKLATAN